VCTEGLELRIRGGGCCGKVSFKRCNSSCWSGSGWVWRDPLGKFSPMPGNVGKPSGPKGVLVVSAPIEVRAP